MKETTLQQAAKQVALKKPAARRAATKQATNDYQSERVRTSLDNLKREDRAKASHYTWRDFALVAVGVSLLWLATWVLYFATRA